MNKDLTYCRNDNCSKRKDCYRYISKEASVYPMDGVSQIMMSVPQAIFNEEECRKMKKVIVKITTGFNLVGGRVYVAQLKKNGLNEATYEPKHVKKELINKIINGLDTSFEVDFYKKNIPVRIVVRHECYESNSVFTEITEDGLDVSFSFTPDTAFICR